MGRFRNCNWNTPTPEGSTNVSNDEVKIALLMDIRDRLDRVLRVLECGNARDIPNILRRISRNTAKPRKKKARVVK